MFDNFLFINNANVRFKRGKDKKKRKSRSLGFFGDRRDENNKKTLTLREPVLKRGLTNAAISGLVGGSTGLAIKNIINKNPDLLLYIKAMQKSARTDKTDDKFQNFLRGKIESSKKYFDNNNKKYQMNNKLARKLAISGLIGGSIYGGLSGLKRYNDRKKDLKNYNPIK